MSDISNIAYDEPNHFMFYEDQITESYLVRQAKNIYIIKKYISFLSVLDKVFSHMGISNRHNQEKKNFYQNLQTKLEKEFLAILQEIATTLLFEQELELLYLQRGITKKQLEKIQIWDHLESKKRCYQEKGKVMHLSEQKKLDKSIASVYHSFL